MISLLLVLQLFALVYVSIEAMHSLRGSQDIACFYQQLRKLSAAAMLRNDELCLRSC